MTSSNGDFPFWKQSSIALSQDEPPEDGILTRTLFNDDDLKAVIFGFGLGLGQELSEHTASMPAILHFVQGKATVTLADDVIQAQPGTWVHMPANLKHSIKTTSPVVMLLLLLKPRKAVP